MIWLGPFESHQTNLVQAAFLAGLKTALKDKIRIIVSDPKMQGESKAALSSFCEFREPENLDVAIDFFDDKYRIYLILDFSLNEPARDDLFAKLAAKKGIEIFLISGATDFREQKFHVQHLKTSEFYEAGNQDLYVTICFQCFKLYKLEPKPDEQATQSNESALTVPNSNKNQNSAVPNYGLDAAATDRRGKPKQNFKITGIEGLSESKVLMTTNDPQIRLYDLRNLSLACKYKGHTNFSSLIKAPVLRDNKFIICGSENSSVYIWKLIQEEYNEFYKVSYAKPSHFRCFLVVACRSSELKTDPVSLSFAFSRSPTTGRTLCRSSTSASRASSSSERCSSFQSELRSICSTTSARRTTLSCTCEESSLWTTART